MFIRVLYEVLDPLDFFCINLAHRLEKDRPGTEVLESCPRCEVDRRCTRGVDVVYQDTDAIIRSREYFGFLYREDDFESHVEWRFSTTCRIQVSL